MSADTTISASDSDRIAIMQLAERDKWIGWQRDEFLTAARQQPTQELALWIWQRLDQQLDELYLVDLENDGLHWPTLWSNPTDDAIAKLEREAIRCRAEHRQTANPTGLKARLDLGERVTPFAPTKGTRQ